LRSRSAENQEHFPVDSQALVAIGPWCFPFPLSGTTISLEGPESENQSEKEM